MEKNYFIFLFCLIFAISYSQHSDKDSNLKSLRKLESGEETILIGFDKYKKTLINSNQDLNLTFNTYILLKNWNLSRIKENNKIKLNNISIDSSITYINETEFTDNAKFECSYGDKIVIDNFYRACEDEQPYCLIKYICQFISNRTFFPKKINLVTDFLNNNSVNLNGSSISYESTSSQALKRDITKLDYNYEDFKILKNSYFVSKSLNSFKIKDGVENGNIFESNNIDLITMINGYPKKIPCKGKNDIYDGDDKSYYFLETNGKYNLPTTDLKYTIANYTKLHRAIILDFKEGENTAFIEKKNIPSRSKGLSTGGTIAIIIPTCFVLFGVTALAFFLSRKPTTPSPIKNIGNNTIGVASTEAIIHQ